MNQIAIARLVLAVGLLGAPLGVGLAACGGNAEELSGTETGNPPDVDKRRLRLEWTENGVELIGDAGAVPAGAEVRLRNTRTGETAAGTAGADGSIRLSVAGSLSDPYEITVSAGGGHTTEPLAASDATTLSGAECSSLEATLRETIATTFMQAPRECSSHRDCAPVFWNIPCFNGCGESTIDASAADSTLMLAAERVAPICVELEGCERDQAGCPEPTSFPVCIEGRCDSRSLLQLSCEELGNEASLRRIAAMEDAERVCEIDADCTMVGFGVSCFEDCGVAYAVSSSAVQEVRSDVETIESQFCGQYDAANCPAPIAPPCVPSELTPRVTCFYGRCEVVFEIDP